MSYLEKIVQAAHDPRAPEVERRDAESQLFRQLFSGINSRDLYDEPGIDPEELVSPFARVQAEGDSLRKAVVLNQTYYRMIYPREQAEQRRLTGRKSMLYVNDLGVLGPGQSERWAEKPTQTGGFEFLRYMVQNVDLLQAIILTRVRQVSAFCRPYNEDDANPLGYRLVRRDGERFTEDDEREVKRLERILENCGTEFDPVERKWTHRRRTFKGFIEALVNDTLTADACPIEIEATVNGGTAGWYNIPFETVRLAYETGYEGDDNIVAIQLHPEGLLPLLGYEKREIVYEVRNPRSSLYMHDYGFAENEVVLRSATSYLNTHTFNSASVDRNAIPRGFLTLYGRFGKRSLADFRTRWNAMLRGAAHRWNLPVLVSPGKNEGGASYTAVDTEKAEMFGQQWIIFLASIMCAAHSMAPEEINIKSFTGQSSGGIQGKDTSEKLQSGRDKGLIPIMLWLETMLNDNIIARFTKKYRLVWVGLYAEDEEQKAKRQEATLTVDEMRAIDGELPHEDPDIGQAPVNPVHMSLYAQKIMQRMQQEAMQQQGMGDPSDPWGQGDGGHPSGLPSSELPEPYLRHDQPKPDGTPAPGQPPQQRPQLGGPQPRMGLPAPGGVGDKFGAGGFAKAEILGPDGRPARSRKLVVDIRDLGRWGA